MAYLFDRTSGDKRWGNYQNNLLEEGSVPVKVALLR